MNPTLPIDCPSCGPTLNDPEKRLWLMATGVAAGVAMGYFTLAVD